MCVCKIRGVAPSSNPSSTLGGGHSRAWSFSRRYPANYHAPLSPHTNLPGGREVGDFFRTLTLPSSAFGIEGLRV